jgi:hypothetical protein
MVDVPARIEVVVIAQVPFTRLQVPSGLVAVSEGSATEIVPVGTGPLAALVVTAHETSAPLLDGFGEQTTVVVV